MCTDRPNNEGKIIRESQIRNTFPVYKPDGRDFKGMHNLIPLAVRIQVQRRLYCKQTGFQKLYAHYYRGADFHVSVYTLKF